MPVTFKDANLEGIAHLIGNESILKSHLLQVE